MVAIFRSTANRRLTEVEARREAATDLSESLRVAGQQVVFLTQLSDYPSEDALTKAREALETIEAYLKSASSSIKTVKRNMK